MTGYVLSFLYVGLSVKPVIVGLCAILPANILTKSHRVCVYLTFLDATLYSVESLDIGK